MRESNYSLSLIIAHFKHQHGIDWAIISILCIEYGDVKFMIVITVKVFSKCISSKPKFSHDYLIYQPAVQISPPGLTQ